MAGYAAMGGPFDYPPAGMNMGAGSFNDSPMRHAGPQRMVPGEQLPPGMARKLAEEELIRRMREEAQIASLGGQVAPWNPNLLGPMGVTQLQVGTPQIQPQMDLEVGTPQIAPQPQQMLDVGTPRIQNVARRSALRRPRPQANPIQDMRAYMQSQLNGL